MLLLGWKSVKISSFAPNFNQLMENNTDQNSKHTITEWFKNSLKPIRNFLSPLQERWSRFVLPLSDAWKKYREKNPRESKVVIWAFRLFLIGFISVFLIVLFALFGVFGPLPTQEELQEIETANASKVYSADNVLIGKYYTENRTTISLDSISPYLVTALLAIEDKRFFEHSGIDLISWMRVFKGIATNNKSLGGGSTLSQQLAKNLFPRKDYLIPGMSLFINKVKENIISIRLENIYNKEELLMMYLNTVPFGGRRYGIQEAARYFYGKRPRQLTADQAATLIGMLKATTALDPTRNPENSRKRRDLVLTQMLKNKDFRFDSDEMATISKMISTGALSQQDYDMLIKQPINASIHEDIGNNEGIGTYFREFLRTKELPKILKNLKKADGNEYNIYTDGLKIYTTLDSKMQVYAEESVYKHMSYLQEEFYKHWKGVKNEKPWGDDRWIDNQVEKSPRYKSLIEAGKDSTYIDSIFRTPVPMTIFHWADRPTVVDTLMTPLDSVRYYFTLLNTGFMAMDHSNGYVKAWVGGTDFLHFKYDHILSKRQVGSTFKPIVYTAAIESGMSPCQFLHNEEIDLEGWSPKNSDGGYGGYYTLMGGLTYSINTIAAKLIYRVGIQPTLDMAKKLGIKTSLPREFGISLGAVEIPLYEMMSAYATIANKGRKTRPVTVLRIEDRHGNVIYDYKEYIEKNQPAQVIDSTTSYMMTRMMRNVIIYGTGNRFRSQYCTHCDFAGKTGTTQNHSDGWFIGYNPELLTGAWVGGVSPAVRFRSMTYGSGSALALPIVGQFWYKLSIDSKFSKITQKTFERNEQLNEEMNCPLRIGISPDTYYLIMQDSVLKDSLIRTGFRSLNTIAEEMFPEESQEEHEGNTEEVETEQNATLHVEEKSTKVIGNIPKEANKPEQTNKKEVNKKGK